MAAVGTKRTPARQSGAALLIMLALISVVIVYAVVSGLNRSAASLAQARAQKTATALAQAKEALIAYAVTYGDDASHTKRVPGFLPCPDTGSDPEGEAASSCGSFVVSVMGRLPWKTLGLDALKDGSGECLWYAVSGTYKSNPNGMTNNNAGAGSATSNNMMNWDTNGQFRVLDANSNVMAGSTEDERAVAVIFAPGKVLPGQDRTPVSGTPVCGGNPNDPTAYLEAANGTNNSTLTAPSSPSSPSDPSDFVAGTESDSFNDRLIYITRAEIWNAIKKRSDFSNYLRALTRRAAECTAMYGTHNSGWGKNKLLPWASKLSLSTSSLPIYAVNHKYDDDDGRTSGRLPFRVNTSDSETGNSISSNILDHDNTDAYLFTPASPSPGSYCDYTAEQKIWYENWKDHLFYALADSFKPSKWNWVAPSCGTCLKINTIGNFAAVVIFAGEKLSDPALSRNNAIDKGSSVANYLETPNSTAILADTGGGDYKAADTNSNFNDIVYAIDTNLNIKCFNGSAMVSVPAAATAPPADPTNYAACP